MRNLRPAVDRVGVQRDGARSLPAGAFAGGRVGAAVMVAGGGSRRADPPPATATEHARRNFLEGHRVAARKVDHADLRPRIPALEGPSVGPCLAVAGHHPARHPHATQRPLRPLAPGPGLDARFDAGRRAGRVGIVRARRTGRGAAAHAQVPRHYGRSASLPAGDLDHGLLVFFPDGTLFHHACW